MAVFRAAAGLEADDAFDLDFGSAPLHPDVVGQRQEFLEPIVGQLQHLQYLVLAETFSAVENLLAGQAQNICLFGGATGHAFDCSLRHRAVLLLAVPAFQT